MNCVFEPRKSSNTKNGGWFSGQEVHFNQIKLYVIHNNVLQNWLFAWLKSMVGQEIFKPNSYFWQNSHYKGPDNREKFWLLDASLIS